MTIFTPQSPFPSTSAGLLHYLLQAGRRPVQDLVLAHALMPYGGRRPNRRWFYAKRKMVNRKFAMKLHLINVILLTMGDGLINLPSVLSLHQENEQEIFSEEMHGILSLAAHDRG